MKKYLYILFCFLFNICVADIQSDVYSMRLKIDEIETLISHLEENSALEIQGLNDVKSNLENLKIQVDQLLTSEVFTNISNVIIEKIDLLRSSIASVAVVSLPSNVYDTVWDIFIHSIDESVLMDLQGVLQDTTFHIQEPLSVSLDLSSSLDFSYFDEWRKNYIFKEDSFREINYFDLSYYTIDETQPKLFYLDNFDPFKTLLKSDHNAWNYGKSFPEMFRAWSDKEDRKFNVINNNLLHIYAALCRTNQDDKIQVENRANSIESTSTQLSNIISSVQLPTLDPTLSLYTESKQSVNRFLQYLPTQQTAPSVVTMTINNPVSGGQTLFLNCEIPEGILKLLTIVRCICWLAQILLIILFIRYNLKWFLYILKFIKELFSTTNQTT